jgi:hypothetical protein
MVHVAAFKRVVRIRNAGEGVGTDEQTGCPPECGVRACIVDQDETLVAVEAQRVRIACICEKFDACRPILAWQRKGDLLNRDTYAFAMRSMRKRSFVGEVSRMNR